MRIVCRAGRHNAALFEEAQVELDVLADHGAIADERLQIGGDVRELGCARDVIIADIGQPLDAIGDRALRIDEGAERLAGAVEVEADGADLHDRVAVRIQSCRL